ncbi:MAG: J domain-containing protein [Chitinophagales bacterium]|nr:J domain-containing protein [Chitinophagales bacterium]
MSVVQIKDYYKILDINSSASTEEVKKAYRKMAMKYHPDTNDGDSFLENYFREVQEAYSVLGHVQRRAKYDEERWLAGMTSRSEKKEQATPEWILKEAIKLNSHMARIDVYGMSHEGIKDYVLQLLNDKHMTILLRSGGTSVNEGIVSVTLQSVKKLKYDCLKEVADRLQILSEEDTKLNKTIQDILNSRRKQMLWEQRIPYVIGLATLFIVLCMYFWVKK